MITTVLLIRHGETPWNLLGKVQGCTNIDLSEAGIFQAHQVSERLGGNFDRVFTSPLNRAFETAKIICEPTSLAPIPLEPLREVNFGSWEGHTFKEIAATYPDEYAHWKVDDLEGKMVDGDQSIKNVSRRAKACIEEQVKAHQGETLIMVSHGGLIKSALIGLFGWKMSMYHHFALGNTCITSIRFNEALEPMLIGLNDTNHLLEAVTTV
ncbi:MAG: histidine phosphatase family protein [Clostridium sp.]|nr:histidine phosphatase family protein [Clostridium sp.]